MGDENKRYAILSMFLIITIAFSLWYRELTLLPYLYIIPAILLGGIYGRSMLSVWDKYFAVQVIGLFLILRNVIYIATQYSAIPFADPYWDFAVIENFSNANRFFVIPVTLDSTTQLTWYSGWPILHILTIMLSRVSGIDIFPLVLMMPSVISTVTMAFAYLLIAKICRALHMSSLVTGFALLAYIASADTLFWPIRFTHQNLGILLFTAILYLICRALSSLEWNNFALILTFAGALVFAHHYTSFLAVSYMLLLSAVTLVGKRFPLKPRIISRFFWRDFQAPRLWGIAAMLLLSIIAWWINVGTFILPFAASVIVKVSVLIQHITQIDVYAPSAFYPNALTSGWILSILTIRDTLIYVPALVGFPILWLKKTENPHRTFLFYSLFIFGLSFIVEVLFTRIEPYRMFTLFMPFLGILTGVSYSKLTDLIDSIRPPDTASNTRNASLSRELAVKPLRLAASILVVTIVVLIVSSSFVGLWGHRYAPLHLYDPKISMIDVGEHQVDYLRLKPFFSNYVAYGGIDVVLADDPFPLYVLLPTTEYSKIARLSESGITAKPGDPFPIETPQSHRAMIVELRDLNLYEYYYFNSPPIKPSEITFYQSELQSFLEENRNCVYSDGQFKIWY